MNKRIKKLWIEALRSPYAVQTQTVLHQSLEGHLGMCCLGVLCQIHAETTGNGIFEPECGYIVDAEDEYAENNEECKILFPFVSNEVDLPKSVLKWAELTRTQEANLIDMNDKEKATFAQIADYIEKNL